MSMTPEEVDAFLEERHLAHFATVDERGHPRVRPLWYLWRDKVLWFTTRMQARHTGRDFAGGKPVAVSIASEERPYRVVIAHGRPEVLGKDRELLLAIATRYGDEEGRAWVDDEAMPQEDRVAFRLTPDPLITWDYGE